MIENATSQMAQEDQMRIMSKINLFERDPKAALLTEIEYIIDDEKRYEFELFRQKVLSGAIKSETEILDEAETMMVNSDKKECI